MKNIMTFILMIFITLSAHGSATVKQIDEIVNNPAGGATNISLNPTNAVDIGYFAGEKALQSNASKELEESVVTITELGYLSGVTSLLQGQLDGKESTLPLTTQGDILYENTGRQRLPIGTSGQLLSASAGGIPEWINAPSSSPLTTKGDIYVYDTDNQRLGVGTAGQVLSVNLATATGLEWIDAPSSTPTTTQGDLILRGVTEDERLAIGAANEYLKSNGTTAEWATVTAAASFTTVTKAASVTLLVTGEDNVICDSAGADRVLTLPTAVGNNGLTYHFNNSVDANKCTVDADGAEIIGDELNVVMQSKGDKFSITSNNVKWVYLSDGIAYAARYTSNAGQTINSTISIVSYEDLDYDTHTMCDGAGTCTIPVSGKYKITARIHTSNASFTAGNNINLYLVDNTATTLAQRVLVIGRTASDGYGIAILDDLNLDKDQTIEVRAFSSVTTTALINTVLTAFSIHRIN